MAQTVKNLPAIQEMQVLSLGWKDPLEKERATHSSLLAWRIPWTEAPGRLQSMGLQESDTTERLTHTQSQYMTPLLKSPKSFIFHFILLGYFLDVGIVKAVVLLALTPSSLVGVLTEHTLSLREEGCQFLPLAPRCS